MQTLIVDDNEANRYLLRALLEGHGHAVEEARHGAEALDRAREHRPELVISDLLMPVMDGYTLLRRWKEDELLRAIPFVVYTATYTEPRDERLALELGADAFIIKPSDPDEFIERIEQVRSAPHARAGAPTNTPAASGEELLEHYSRVLVGKLEQKIGELERSNRDLAQRIRERELAEAALVASELRYRRLFESAKDGIAILDPASGEVLDANPCLLSMLGRERETVLGRELWQLGLFRDREAPAAALAELRRDGCVRHHDLALRTAGGPTIDVELVCSTEQIGDRTVVQCNLRDVSDRKLADELRHELAAAMDAAVEAVMITRADGTIRYVNRAFTTITGYAREEALGQNPRLLQSGEHERAFYEQLWHTIASGEVWRGQIVNRRRDGTLYTAQLTVAPILDAGGQVVEYVALQHDITRQLTMQNRLAQVHTLEAVGKLAAGVAHDFNNILQVVMGHAELLALSLSLDEAQRADFDELLLTVRRGAALARELLVFGRSETEPPELLDLNVAVREVRKLLCRTIGEDVDLQLDLAHDPATVLLASVHAQQVLLNLAVNARDAMPHGGVLRIATRHVVLDDGQPVVCLSVSDTGVGMTPEMTRRIFEPYFTSKANAGGTGLGLATVHSLVQAAGGQVTVSSELGAGARFDVFFPARSSVASAAEASADRAAPQGHGETVLVVEDEAPIRRLVQRHLEWHGYRVLVATNAAEAHAVTAGESPEILLTDVVLRGPSGPELAEQLTARFPNLKVVYMSGYAEERLFGAGLPDPIPLLRKPFGAPALLAMVHDLVRPG